MEKAIHILFGFLFYSIGILNAQSVEIPSASINPTPLPTIEENGQGEISFSLVETAGVAVPATFSTLINISITVDFQNITLTSGDVSLITGSLLEFFNVSFNATDNILKLEQKEVFPAFSGAVIKIPITVTNNTSNLESGNGFNANIVALDPNTNAEGSSSIFTFTQRTNSTNAVDDVNETMMNISVSGNVLDNDEDFENDTQTVNTTPVSDVSNGTLILNADGSYIYTPNSDFIGEDSFVYEVCDNGTPSACDSATVNIIVNAIDPCDISLAGDADCDGDGVSNSQEASDRTNPNDACDFRVANQNTIPSDSWRALDCDGDGVSNDQEVKDGTNPKDNCDFRVASQDARPSSVWNAKDCDGDSVSNGQEIIDETNPNDGCDYKDSNQVLGSVSVDWNALDCDGDGVTNGREILDSTNLNDGCDLIVASRDTTPSDIWNAKDCSDGFDIDLIKLYPNPMLDYVEINLKRIFQFIRVDVVNSKGQILMHEEFRDTSRIRIPFEQSSGLYFFKVQTQRGIKTFKVVKY